jgi:hypothetical protein
MSLIEAEDLLSFIEIDHMPGGAHVHLLGNGRDYVVILGKHTYHVWNAQDWLAYRQREETASIAKMRKQGDKAIA